jgi:threonine aldolase
MPPFSRRDLLKAGAALAVAGHVDLARSQALEEGSGGSGPPWMNVTSDGLHLTPAEHAARIHRLADEKGFAPDDYSLGGVVAALETAFAAVLGKEAAIFMPTGTLANQLAVSALAQEHRGAGARVLVQGASHLYNDTGDALTNLSGMNMVPLGQGSATFTVAEVEAQVARSAGGRVATRDAVLVVESPVRRCNGELFDPEELHRVLSFARSQGIALHLDGARMLIASAYNGLTPAAMAAPFDTVYVSLYKGLNAPSGAILAGPASRLQGMFHARRMFGGGLPEAWPFAAGALEDLPGFVGRVKSAVAVSEQVFQALASRGIPVRRVPRGTNVAFLGLGPADPAGVQKALADGHVRAGVPPPGARELRVVVNESWSRRDPRELAQVLARALGRG